MHRFKSAVIVTTLAVAIAGATFAAAGQNLVSNGRFSKNTNGWGVVGTDTVMSVDAAHLKVTSVTAGFNGNYAAIRQCVPGVQAGATYRMAADTFFATLQPRHGTTHIRMHFMSGTDCTGFLGTVVGPEAAVAGAWTHLSVDGVAPAGTHSVVVDLIENEAPAAQQEAYYLYGDFEVLFDNVVLSKLGGGK